MTSALQRLSMIGSAPIRAQADRRRLEDVFSAWVAAELFRGLEFKNGYYAFESALHVLPDIGGLGEQGLVEWNSQELWRHDYEGMASGAAFFAEDIFGTQFCLREDGVFTFDPEMGTFEAMATDLEGWAQAVLDDYSLWTGHRVAHEWQVANGPLDPGMRLIPKVPFMALLQV